ncbi:MAG: 2'-5' RNA ligase family protein [Halobacteriales archaeon]
MSDARRSSSSLGPSARELWISAELHADDLIRTLRDRLYRGYFGAPNNYDRVDPHLTVHPGVVADRDTAVTARQIAERLVGEHVYVRGLDVYPGRANPGVIMLDADVAVDLESVRERVENAVTTCGGKVTREPVPAHITLFKRERGDTLDGLPSGIHPGQCGGWSTPVTSIRLIDHNGGERVA